MPTWCILNVYSQYPKCPLTLLMPTYNIFKKYNRLAQLEIKQFLYN